MKTDGDTTHRVPRFEPEALPEIYGESLEERDNDPVNHPSHYTASGIETIDVIEAWDLDFCLGNAVKYISRAGKKDPEKELEDLKKARWYVDRRIEQIQNRGKTG
jgi:hypothetical protein